MVRLIRPSARTARCNCLIANPTDPAQQLRVAVTPTGQILVAYTFPDISPNPSGYNDYLVAG